MRRDCLHNRSLKITHVGCGTMEVRNRLMKAGKIICVDGGHFKSLQLPKSFLKFQKPGSGKVILLNHM